MVAADGRHSFVYAAVYAPEGVPNWMFPLDDTLASVYEVPRSVHAKGSVIAVSPSSAWFPTSVVPGTISPVD
jgi:hypothetical protein